MVQSGMKLEASAETTLEGSSIRAVLLSHEEFDRWWPDIQRVMDTVPHTWEHHTKEEIYFRAMNDTLQVWAVGDAAIKMILFTQVASFATKNVLQVIWASGLGELEEKIDAIAAALEYFAKLNRCSEVDVIGRPGWGKVLKRLGFKRTAEVFTMKILHGGLQ